MATLNNIDKVLQAKMQRALGKLPVILANDAVNWSKENFRKQGWPGQSFQAWKPRSATAKRNKGRALLIDSSRLSRSIRVISTGPLRASIGTDVPYARAHNDGFKGTVNVKAHRRVKTGMTVRGMTKMKTVTGYGQVKAHQRSMNMPRRRFIGYSPVLKSILMKKSVIIIAKELKS